MAYHRDQKLVYVGDNKSKPPIVTLAGDPEDFLIRLKCVKTNLIVWCNSALMKANWMDSEEAKKKGLGPEALTGKQKSIFNTPKTVKEQWREKTIKK